MSVIAIVVSVLLALVFAQAGQNKFSGSELARVCPGHLGITPGTYRLVGVLEILAAIGLIIGVIAIPELAAVASIGLALLMVGAVALHLRAGDPFRIAPGFLQRRAESIRGWLPAAALGLLAIANALLILAS
ncbi:MAG: DoxX family protein [Solirubrobacterales bacterium]